MGKNPKPRDWSHLGKIKADVLFITGDKDQLCPQDELAAAQKYLTKPFVSEIVPGDHSYKPRGEAAAQQACLSWMRSRFC
jgi:surfactin synthase thioesterase subunit